MLESGNDHGCHNMRTLPDVNFFAGFQRKKDNIVYFSAGFEAIKYTSQRFGFNGLRGLTYYSFATGRFPSGISRFSMTGWV